MDISRDRSYGKSITRMMRIAAIVISYIFIAWLVCYAVLVNIDRL